MYIHVQKVRGNPTIIQRIKNHKRKKNAILISLFIIKKT